MCTYLFRFLSALRVVVYLLSSQFELRTPVNFFVFFFLFLLHVMMKSQRCRDSCDRTGFVRRTDGARSFVRHETVLFRVNSEISEAK